MTYETVSIATICPRCGKSAPSSKQRYLALSDRSIFAKREGPTLSSFSAVSIHTLKLFSEG